MPWPTTRSVSTDRPDHVARSPIRPIGHLRTVEAGDRPLARGGPIAQWESASFARRMPRVRIPVGPYSEEISGSFPLSGSDSED